MPFRARFVHINIIARNWERLAAFYEQVFGCVRVPPERNFSGQWLEEVTGVPGAAIRGVHLKLPGYDDQGPTLEIFEYSPQKKPPGTAVNRPGFAHIAFAVDDVETARDAVLASGGTAVGELVSVDIPEAGRITFIYVTDPEGNIIELQKWSR
ncbi:MAG: VOC family protein [Deltaproteobacteria bacterium]|nr:VOC family protein [Deltaproteobacteria bacterium]